MEGLEIYLSLLIFNCIEKHSLVKGFLNGYNIQVKMQTTLYSVPWTVILVTYKLKCIQASI